MFLSTRVSGCALASALAAAALTTAAAKADTLADVILLAYRTNPSLASQRAQLRALDESVVQAKTGYRPTLSASLSTTFDDVQTRSAYYKTYDAFTSVGSAGLNYAQPIYTGGRTRAAVRSAEATVRAGREALGAGEQSILQSVIQYYMDVRRDQQIVEIRQAELTVLQGQLDDARQRFKAGDVTETDVLQSQSQLESARATLLLAQGQLQNSRANFAAVVGESPGELEPESPLPGLPVKAEDAFDLAEAENPSLKQVRLQELASREKIAQARAANRPTIALQASGGAVATNYSGLPFYRTPGIRSVTVQLALTQSLFTGGLNSSYIRQAIETNNSDQINVEVTRRNVVQSVSQAWNALIASRASAEMDARQIATAKAYFEDTEIEYHAGQRSTLDVLVAEQALTAAKLAQASAHHDAYLGQVALLSAMGRLRPQALLDNFAAYDATANARRVNRIGATPWDPVVSVVDSIGAPHAPAARAAPVVTPNPTPAAMKPGTQDVPADAPLITAGHR
ncbi:MAG: TolC family outer membrane protein [Caulobacteraceae bacterium]|nr:TolC family outer membrane protein [Caulobacteraceae bacterium]